MEDRPGLTELLHITNINPIVTLSIHFRDRFLLYYNHILSKKAGNIIVFYIIAIIVVLIDQITKFFIRTYIDIDQAFVLWGFPLTHIENSGMAGGLLPGNARLFGIVAVLFVIGVVYTRKTSDMKGVLIDSSFGFLVGGAIGNGIDRFLYGQVTDFIIRRGGVLNIADHAIEVGLLLFIMYNVINWFKKRSQFVKH